MVEYTYDEAIKVLETSLANAQEKLVSGSRRSRSHYLGLGDINVK